MTNEISAKQILRDPIHFLAFGFGSGLSPILPGTCGTIVGVLIYVCIAQFTWPFYLAFVIAMSLLGIWICGVSARRLGVHDYSGIVWDEIVGYLLTMFLVPFVWYWMLLGFVLFRVFDIWKPWPIRGLDHKVPGGLGIMLDDLVAAVYAWAVLHLIIILI